MSAAMHGDPGMILIAQRKQSTRGKVGQFGLIGSLCIFWECLTTPPMKNLREG